MRRAAFTLVELLTVVAIISVLSGILFSVVTSAKSRAQHAVCAENLHSLGVGIALYANDNEGWVPPATTAEFVYPHVAKAELRASPSVLIHAIAPYIKNSAIWFCPADPQKSQDVLWLGQRHLLTSYHFLPRSAGDQLSWPPKMQLGRDKLTPSSEDVPLLSDAVGMPWIDSDSQFASDNHRAASNHQDRMVNALRHDLSLSRKTAKFWVGSEE